MDKKEIKIAGLKALEEHHERRMSDIRFMQSEMISYYREIPIAEQNEFWRYLTAIEAWHVHKLKNIRTELGELGEPEYIHYTLVPPL